MTLPATPPITAQDINVELGRAASAPFSINGAEERALAGIPSGAIAFTDFLGKTNAITWTTPVEASGSNTAGAFSINADIGAANANKTVLVVGHGAWPTGVENTGFASISIDGTGATTRAFKGLTDGTQGIAVWIITAEVSTAGVVAIAGTYAPTGVAGQTKIAVYTTVQNFTITEALTGFANTAVSPIEASVAIDVSEAGAVIAGMTSSQQTNNTTWTGVTEIYDADFNSTFRASGGKSEGLGLQSNRTVKGSQVIADVEGQVIAAISTVKA